MIQTNIDLGSDPLSALNTLSSQFPYMLNGITVPIHIGVRNK